MALKLPITPGDVISRLLTKYKISIEDAASRMNLPASVLRTLLVGDYPISPAMAFMLERVFKDNSAHFWFTLQQVYDQYEFEHLQKIKYGGPPSLEQTADEIYSAVLHELEITNKLKNENT